MVTTNALTDYAENAALDHIMGTAAWTMPTGVYLQLHTGAPGEDGTGNVAAFTTRTEISSWNAASALAVSNDGAVAITGFSTTETISHWSLWDASSGGNCLVYGDFATPRQAGTGVTLTIGDGELDIDFDSTDLATYGGNSLLDHLVGASAMTSPTNIYVQYHTGAPGLAGTANVASLSTRTLAGAFSAASGGATDNDAAIDATGVATETISHLSVWDASTSGNCIWAFAATASQAIASGETLSIPAGDLDFALS